MSNVRRTADNYSTGIQQRVNSGQHFDGTFPTGDSPTPALPGPRIYKYGPQNAGGLFFWDSNEPIVCSQFHCDLGASGDFHLYLVNLDPASVIAGTPAEISGESIKIEEQTGTSFVALDEARFKTILMPFQALKLVTSASGAVQIAQAVGALERTYIR
jgi:hypothetical protein